VRALVWFDITKDQEDAWTLSSSPAVRGLDRGRQPPRVRGRLEAMTQPSRARKKAVIGRRDGVGRCVRSQLDR
jgi:hypothetical protein